MNLRFDKYIIVLVLGVVAASCRQAKYVSEDHYLLSGNSVLYQEPGNPAGEWEKRHDQINEGDVNDLIVPEPNSGLKLWIYNRIDSAKYNHQVERKTEKYKRKAALREKKVKEKNEERVEKARAKGKTHYRRKRPKDKKLRLGFRNWIATHWGEEPVLLDTAKVTKSKEQMRIFLSQRGFKNAVVTDSISYNEKKRKASVCFYVKPGKPYVINSIAFDSIYRNRSLMKLYDRMVRKEGTAIHVGDLLDEDKLDDERDHFTKFLKDNAYFGFTKNYINFVVDTTIGNHQADVVIYIKEKRVPDPRDPSKEVVLDHQTYYVNDITYKLHNPDSLSFKDWEGYKKRCEELGLSYPYLDDDQHYFLLDTTFIVDTIITDHFMTFNSDLRKKHHVGIFEKFTDTIIQYKGYFIYNEIPVVKPALLDKQNFLEHSYPERKDYKYAQDYYIDRTIKSLLRLEVFARMTPKLEIAPSNPLGRLVDVTYDLTPAPKQQFTLEPRATNTSSILGVSGVLKYVNKNLTRTANKLSVSLEGGFQSQPLLVSGDTKEGATTFRFRGFNTFEIGPEVTYRIPRFYPMTKKMQAAISKRSFPSTQVGSLYNFQLRPDFTRHIAEVSYKWEFSVPPDRVQNFTVIPLRFDYVYLKKTAEFDSVLAETNDPYLINSYSNFFSIGVLNIKYEYNNSTLPKTKRRSRFKDDLLNFTIELSAAGLVMNTIHALADKTQSFSASFNEQGKLLFGVPFSQYAKLENSFTYNHFINKKHRMVYRLIIGTGFTYGNGIGLPYTQSFVAGGSNDIRAFDARTMAPGGTQAWADSTATETQIGDMKGELNLEWRFRMGGNWNGALFLDAGNIWKLNSTDPNDPGLFRFSDFYKQVAIGTGFGIRYDLTFLMLRLDLSWAIHNPYLPAGARWWLTNPAGKQSYIDSFRDDSGKLIDYVPPHGLNIFFAIGYPF